MVLVVAGMLGFYLSGFGSLLTLEKLKEEHQGILEFYQTYPLFTPLLFFLAYVVMVTLSIPGAALFTILGGYLFRQPLGTFITVMAATTGACCLFLAAKTAIGDFFLQRAGNRFLDFKRNFEKDAWSYLLFLRLVPLFPFWLVNLGLAVLGVRWGTFVWTTCLGIIPGTFVYTQIGTGLSTLIEKQEVLASASFMHRDIVMALVGLGLLALFPIILKKIGKKKAP